MNSRFMFSLKIPLYLRQQEILLASFLQIIGEGQNCINIAEESLLKGRSGISFSLCLWFLVNLSRLGLRRIHRHIFYKVSESLDTLSLFFRMEAVST